MGNPVVGSQSSSLAQLGELRGHPGSVCAEGTLQAIGVTPSALGMKVAVSQDAWASCPWRLPSSIRGCLRSFVRSFIHSHLHVNYSPSASHTPTPVPGLAAPAGTTPGQVLPSWNSQPPHCLSTSRGGGNKCLAVESSEIFKNVYSDVYSSPEKSEFVGPSFIPIP